jgi:serine/threonine protein kinase
MPDSDPNDITRSHVQLAHGSIIGHYRIIERIGAGGMGEVYLAEDTKLDRKVALKFLPLHLCQDPECRARFTREAQAAAKLDHPNIVAVHEVSEFQGRPFFAMQHVEGETLKEVIAGKPLPLDRIIEIGIQVSDGLRAAHEKGITHRDIKPSNILIDSNGRARIVDFGLASVLGTSQLTKTGSTLGTIGYMSPEQVRGDKVDHRTDLFSFGVVLYEMITGHLPFRGEHEATIMYALVHAEPQLLSRYRTDVPPHVALVVSTCMQKDRAMRYQTIQELISDLKNAPVIRLPKQEKSIVVLPFENLSPDPDQEYFSDGLTEEVISDLSAVRSLRVTSRSSAMTFKGTKTAIPEIARRLNVQYVLEGSVRKAGNNLRITAQLIDAQIDAHIWADKYSGTLDDVFDIQEKVSRSIVDALRLTITSEEDRRLAERPIDNSRAYECYLRARQEIWRFTPEGFDRAIQLVRNALDIVGENEMLQATLGMVYWQYIYWGLRPSEEYLPKLEECIQKVVRLNPESSHGFLLQGWITQRRGDTQESIRNLKKALTIDANNPDVLFWICLLLSFVGKTSLARPLAKRLLLVDPLMPINNFVPGILDWFDGDLKGAIQPFARAHQMDPTNPHTQFWYAYILACNNQTEEALSVLNLLPDGAPATPLNQGYRFLKYALQGDKKRATQCVTAELLTTSRDDFNWSWVITDLYSLIDARQEALDWLDNSIRVGVINYPFLSEYDPFLQNLRGEERFKKLMERVKYEWEHFEA